MFIIVVYDINKKRVAKFNKICKKYLFPLQKSVFEGNISYKSLTKMQHELKQNMVCDEDSVCIYQLESSKYAYKLQLGKTPIKCNIL